MAGQATPDSLCAGSLWMLQVELYFRFLGGYAAGRERGAVPNVFQTEKLHPAESHKAPGTGVKPGEVLCR